MTLLWTLLRRQLAVIVVLVPPSTHPYLLALGEALRERRDERGLSQAALAVQVGVSQRRIWEWENGLRDLRVSSSLLKLAVALGTTVALLTARAEQKLADRAVDAENARRA